MVMFLFSLVIILVSYYYIANRPADKISIIGDIQGNGVISAGQSITLTVQIKNMSDVDVAQNVFITIAPSENSVVQVIGQNPIDIGTLGPYETRLPNFVISIAQSALRGTYNITISTHAGAPFEGDSKVIAITVE
jgi:uncharacterized repeat protein (TIGR01451 family)